MSFSPFAIGQISENESATWPLTPLYFLFVVCKHLTACVVFVLQRSGRDPQRGENLSAKSSDSDVSDVSAVSRTSSASRFSSMSYISVQSERPRGSHKIRWDGLFSSQDHCQTCVSRFSPGTVHSQGSKTVFFEATYILLRFGSDNRSYLQEWIPHVLASPDCKQETWKLIV